MSPVMTQEATHLDAIKWPKRCATCGDMVTVSGWLQNHKLYCEAHKPMEGATGGGVDVPTDTTSHSNASKENKPSLPSYQCQNCGDMVAHVTHIISIGGRDIDMNICDRCEWLRRAAWQLKLNGMWKPTPKNEPLREAKP